MPVTVYRSNDASAPVLNNTAGSLVTVLNACLVTGYGAKAGAGWTKEYFFSTTGADYKQGAGSNGFYLHVDDVAPNFARARAFETMSAYNTGSNLVPTDGQQSGGVFFHKTNNVVNNQPWVIVATSKLFYYFSAYDNLATHLNGTMFVFGDFLSEKAVDPYSTMLFGAMGANNNLSDPSPSNGNTTSYLAFYSLASHTIPGHYAMRSHNTAVGGAAMGKHVNFARLGHTTNGSWLNSYAMTYGSGAGGVVYPSPASGGMYLSPIWLHEASVVRGRMPGIYLLQTASAKPAHGDVYTGSGDMTGKTFICVNIWGSQLHIETTDTW